MADVTPKQGAVPPLPRTREAKRYGWLIKAEGQKVLKSRLKRGEPIDLYQAAYCIAVAIDAVAPGRDRLVMMDNGHAYGGVYWQSWGECSPFNVLCTGANRLALSLHEVPDDLLRATERACKDARARLRHKFHKGKTIGRLLGVTSEERKRLGLRIIGAVDADKSKLKEAAVEKKREHDRIRAETKRRDAGAKARKESIAEKARELGISPGAMRVRLHRERLKCNGFVAKYEGVACNGFVAPIETSEAIEETRDCGANSAHVTVSSRHKYCETISLAAHDHPSGETQPAGNADGNPVPAALESAAPDAPAAEPPTTPPETIAITADGERPEETADAGGRAEAPPPAIASPGKRRYTFGPNPRRQPLPPQPDMPEGVPGRNLLQEIGVDLGAFVIRRSHEAAALMLKSCDPIASPEDNVAAMVLVWEKSWSLLRRELIRDGADFRTCIIAQRGMAAITHRETSARSRSAAPEIMAVAPHQTGETHVG